MKGRVYWSKYLYDRGIGKNIMYSGNAVYTPYFEGEIMALYAKAIGIPPEHIYTELKAEHRSWDLIGSLLPLIPSNPKYSKDLSGKKLIRKLVFYPW